MIAICAVSLLAEWSKPGQFQVGFPFLSRSWSVAQQVPGAFDKTFDLATRQAEEKAQSFRAYRGVEIRTVVQRCVDPVPESYQGFTADQLLKFFQASPLVSEWSPEQVAAALGPALCMASPYSAIYVQRDNPNSYVEVTFQTQNGKTKVVGFQHHAPTI